MYSFALFPEQNQPSGSANLGILSRIVLNLEFQDSLCTDGNGVLCEPFNITIYSRSINIIRFISGMAGLAFTYG
jgi:hypothetical protein